MKRGKPLERRTGLARGEKPLRSKTELRPDPDKVREFLRRSGGIRRKPRERPPEGPLSPAEWRKQVFDLSGGRCLITGARARDVEDRRFHAHHPLPKGALRARRLYGRVWDPRNGVLLRSDVHERHEQPGVSDGRIASGALPGSVWEFCAELDALEGTSWATDLVLRGHPAGGVRRRSQQEVHDGEAQAGRRDGDHAESG